MKNITKKMAEIKSATVSKDAANNSTEVVILILFVVVIVFALGNFIMSGGTGFGAIFGGIEEKVSQGTDEIV